MKKLLTRSITGALFVAVMVLCILWNYVLLFNLLLVITCIALFEYRDILWQNGIHLPMVLFYTVCLAVFFMLSVVYMILPYYLTVLIICCLLLLFPLAALFRRRDAEEAFRDLGYMYTAVLWIVVPFSLMNAFPMAGAGGVRSNIQAGQWLMLAFFLTIWANDTFAYCVGSLVGRHPFFERISPKKTWEGTLGGGVLALVLSGFYILFFPQIPFSLLQWLGFATVVVVSGTLGDLVESLFKRRMGVKDSGNILPGHGGVLDRFDSALLAAPFALLYVVIINML
ncbi:MAG: phosphatidate cytidylyltransferase [Bacteroidales bacterium]|nr:phosphatidate cytidylyltransferase [Bacteroidales bacterium]